MIEIKPIINKVVDFRAAGVHADLKKDNALDVALIASGRPCVAAAVATQNHFKGAPILVSQEHLKVAASRIRALVINSKVANAATGQVGIDNARQMAQQVAGVLKCQPEQVLVMSTGVIGQHLPMAKIENGIAAAHEALHTNRWSDAAEAIMTTDTHPKYASVDVMTVNGSYTIAGMAKGSGMIAPNMATMLGMIVTDAKLTEAQAQQTLKTATAQSFNRVTVDGDTSPNDMVTLMANGASAVAIESETDLAQFQEALTALCVHLAQLIVRDGEGATKFITLDVFGAASENDAAQVARTVANSSLVKTAFFGHDANWGRIIAAAGRSGVRFDPDCASLWMAAGTEQPEAGRGLLLFEQGMATNFAESDAAAIVKTDDIYVSLDLGLGEGQATVWTCDLSHDYVSINADYRT